MNYSTSVFTATLTLFMGVNMSVAENIPCVTSEVLALDNNFRDGFHPGHIYQDFWGDEDKELVLVNARDETFYLEVYTSNEAVELCEPDISLKLEPVHQDTVWNHSANDTTGLAMYGFNLTLNEHQSIIMEEFSYGGSRGFEHSHGAFTFRLLNNKTLEWIGYDDGYVGLNYRGQSRSANFITGRYVIVSYPGVMEEEGEVEERWGTFEGNVIRLENGDIFGNEHTQKVRQIFEAQ